MALPVYSIGSFNFVSMRGNPAVYGETTEVFGFPGVDSVDVRLMGKRSDEFILVTLRDFLTIDAARDTLQQYKDLTEAAGQTVILADHNFSTDDDLLGQVLDVRQVSLRRASSICGGLTANSLYLLRAAWRMIWFPKP